MESESFEEYSIRSCRNNPKFEKRTAFFLQFMRSNADRWFHPYDLVEHYNLHNNITVGHVDIKDSQVRLCLRALRVRGNPICSNRRGFCWTTKPRYLAQTFIHLNSRSKAIQFAISKMAAYDSPEVQEWMKRKDVWDENPNQGELPI